jgi:hypothetical protein
MILFKQIISLIAKVSANSKSNRPQEQARDLRLKFIFLLMTFTNQDIFKYFK